MIFSLAGILAKLIKGAIDAEAAKQTPVGGEVIARKVARGVRLFGMRWEIDAILRRTE